MTHDCSELFYCPTKNIIPNLVTPYLMNDLPSTLFYTIQALNYELFVKSEAGRKQPATSSLSGISNFPSQLSIKETK